MSAVKLLGYAAVRDPGLVGARVMFPSIRSSRKDARVAAGEFFSPGRPREGWEMAKAAGFRVGKVRIEVVP